MAYLSPRLGGSGYRRKSGTSAAGRDLQALKEEWQQGWKPGIPEKRVTSTQEATESVCACSPMSKGHETPYTPVSSKVEHPWALRLLWLAAFGMASLALAWPWVVR